MARQGIAEVLGCRAAYGVQVRIITGKQLPDGIGSEEPACSPDLVVVEWLKFHEPDGYGMISGQVDELLQFIAVDISHENDIEFYRDGICFE